MLFSVITVTRNHLDGLKRTRESLRAQGCKDYEWVVIDGASSDGTVGYLHEAFPLTPTLSPVGRGSPSNARTGEGVVIWISEPDRGIYDAMNKGIERARGDYLIFMNAGDVFAAPDVLEKLAVYKDANFIYGDAREGSAYKHARTHNKIAYGMFTHHQSMIYSRALIGNLRYDTNYKIAADYKFTVEFLRRAQKISCMPLPVCIFEPGGISQQKVRLGRNEQYTVRRELKVCSNVKNIFIYAVQTVAMFARRVMPGLYWRFRAVRGSADRAV